MRLVVGEVVRRPGQVRVLQQQGVPIGRLARRHSPGVGSLIGQVRRVALAQGAAGRRDIEEVHQAMGVGHHVGAGDRQHLPHLGRDVVWVLFGIGVDARREGVEVGAEIQRLLRIPLLGALRHAVGQQPDGRLFVIRAPVFGPLAPRFSIQAQDIVAVAARLGPAVAVEG
ncbi:hypothetical protein D3C73_1000950 [compost metagenome]